MVNFWEIVTLSIIEGVTEFLPVSSTGHMIIAKDLLNMESSESLNAFLVIIQFGAIMAVVSVFWKKFILWACSWFFVNSRLFSGKDEALFYRKQSSYFIVSVLPFAVIGFLFKNVIKKLFSIQVVSWALLAGAVLIILDHYILEPGRTEKKDFEKFDLKSAACVGLWQCLALWPGFSRSAATIIGAKMLGYDKKSSAEISFLVGFPALVGVSLYEGIKEVSHLSHDWINYVVLGCLISWGVAYLCVKTFIGFLQKYPLIWFAWYRIVLAVSLIILY